MVGDEDLEYIATTLVWMGGNAAWSEAMIIEQLGDQNLPVASDLVRAEQRGIVRRDGTGLRLTDLGWRLAANNDLSPCDQQTDQSGIV